MAETPPRCKGSRGSYNSRHEFRPAARAGELALVTPAPLHSGPSPAIIRLSSEVGPTRGARMSAPLPADLGRVDPADAWQTWLPDARQSFDARWAGHLFRRAAFGATPDELQTAGRAGLATTIDRLCAGDPRAEARSALLSDTGEQFAREDDTGSLRGWWLYAMLHSGHPLREKLTLFWHNHFATSVAKVPSPLLMFRQNQLLRSH